MGFYLAKLVWVVLSPLNLIFLLFIGGFGLRRCNCRAAALAHASAAALFVLLGVMPVGHDLVASLENRYPRPAMLPAHVDGILILGGALDTDLSAAYGTPLAGLNGQRVLDGMWLARHYPGAKIVFSGGENSLAGHGMPETRFVQDFIVRYGIAPPQQVIYESHSRNTAENLAYSLKLVQPQTGETWLLVTSASHLPRALAIAHAAGWPPMIGWPATYLTDGASHLWPDDFNILGHVFLADVAVREYAGLLAYRIEQP